MTNQLLSVNLGLMATDSVHRELLVDGEISSPELDKVDYPDSSAQQPMQVDIAADAVDQRVDLTALNDIQGIEIDLPSQLKGYLTVKVNTSTQAFPVGEKTVFTEDIDNLYFTSTNSDTEIRVSILPIYE